MEHVVTLEDAHSFAKLLKQSPHVREVELFGSVLRHGSGHDMDCVLVVDEHIARTWWSEMYEDLRVRMGTRWLPLRRVIKRWAPFIDNLGMHARKKRRLARASELLGIDISQLCEEYRPGFALDAFLFPHDWRTNGQLNEAVLNRVIDLQNDRETFLFLQRVARQAVRIV
jgi:hypothetical protein